MSYVLPIGQSPENQRKALNAILADIASRLATQEARLVRGTGSPEGVVTAPVGTLYERDNGGATTSLYVKTSGAGNTGWTAK
jgi:hypothetical protein